MKLKFYFSTFLAFSLTIIILTLPSQCLSLALNGLNLWFERMIPTLFPFMVLSGVVIRMNLTGSFVKICNPVLGRIFSVRSPCVYGMVIGFLCGFPMGAHVAAQLYGQKQVTRAEASFLLAFCNNIGPVYFLSFVLPTLFSGNISPGIKLCLLMAVSFWYVRPALSLWAFSALYGIQRYWQKRGGENSKGPFPLPAGSAGRCHLPVPFWHCQAGGLYDFF